MSDETRKIEITEPGGFRVGADRFQEGEVRILPAAQAQEFINLGWAKCVATGEQGERKPGAQELAVDSTLHSLAATVAA